MEDAGANEAMRLRRNMRMLYALGSVATLLGLIGTISGMIKAFQVAAETRAFLAQRGVDLGGEQETKTRRALEFFSTRLSATASA